MEVRDAHESELAELTKLWHDSWQDSHAHLLPGELIRLRTLDSSRPCSWPMRRPPDLSP